jgi:phospholipase C
VAAWSPDGQLHVSAGLQDRALGLRLGSTSSSPVRFEICSPGPTGPLVVDVRGEHVEKVPVSDHYRVAVRGPERFRFELSGSVTGAAAAVDVQVRPGPSGLSLELRNNGAHEVVLRIRSGREPACEQDVRVVAGGAQPVDWPADGDGYDVEITAPQDASFYRRISGLRSWDSCRGALRCDG